jgi:hypothetical protein
MKLWKWLKTRFRNEKKHAARVEIRRTALRAEWFGMKKTNAIEFEDRCNESWLESLRRWEKEEMDRKQRVAAYAVEYPIARAKLETKLQAMLNASLTDERTAAIFEESLIKPIQGDPSKPHSEENPWHGPFVPYRITG